jgi:hypothetical protein
MKTYTIEILRKAFFEIFDKDKYVHFSVYSAKRGKPFKFKARIRNIHATPEGMKIEFGSVWYKHRHMFDICIPVKDIRWKNNTIDMHLWEMRCKFHVKQIPG